MSLPATENPGSTVATRLMRCVRCATPLAGREVCPACGRGHPARGGIVEAMGPLTGRNRIVAAFYDGPGWQRFRPWERRFLAMQGGERRARMPILQHLPRVKSARILEVGIGDGDNLAFLPADWEIHGVDIARTRLEGCLERFPTMSGRLAQAEAEALPYPDATFDACLCVGGFTLYSDHATALREMRRVTRADGPVVVADEVPWLCRLGIGHLIGVPRIDAWWYQKLGLDREFIGMVFDNRLDVKAVTEATMPDAKRHRIWGGLGYCIVHRGKPNSRNHEGVEP